MNLKMILFSFLTGMSTEDAMTEYVTLAKEAIDKYGMW